MDVLALDEQQRQPVYEAHDVCPPTVEVAMHPHLSHAKEVVVGRLSVVEHSQPLSHTFALVVLEGELHAVADQVVLLAVGGGDGLRGYGSRDLAHCVVVGLHLAGAGSVRRVFHAGCALAPLHGRMHDPAGCRVRSPLCCRRRPTPSRAVAPSSRLWSCWTRVSSV